MAPPVLRPTVNSAKQIRPGAVARVVRAALSAPCTLALAWNPGNSLFKNNNHKTQSMKHSYSTAFSNKSISSVLVAGVVTPSALTPASCLLASASGGSGSGSGGGSGGGSTSTSTIQVNRAILTQGVLRIALQAVSSDSSAHIYAYLPDGTYRAKCKMAVASYGGAVFVRIAFRRASPSSAVRGQHHRSCRCNCDASI